MAFSPTSPVTGATISGLTSPTYTLTADSAPAPNAKQYYVSGLGGNQTGVSVHSVGNRFTIAFWVPKVLQIASWFSTLTGFQRKNPRNVYNLHVVKGVTPATGASVELMNINVKIDIPAGADTIDPLSLKAALSLAFGAAWATASGIADSALTGTA